MTSPTHLLDTNPCIHVTRQRGNKLVKQRFVQHTGLVAVCAVVVGELYHGAEKARDPAAERAKVDRFLAPLQSLDLDTPAARVYAVVRAGLEAKGIRIEDNDLFIAAIALSRGLKVVTHNTRDFGRIPGLDVVDWEVP